MSRFVMLNREQFFVMETDPGELNNNKKRHPV